MTEYESLMFAVCENPEEDTARLVLADWLEENGEPERAEFIRVQIELARTPHSSPARKNLEKRERQLLTVYGQKWRREVGDTHSSSLFKRGFIEHLEFYNRANFARDLEDALESTPLRSASAYGKVRLLEVMAIPHIRRLRYLDLERATVSESDLEAFAEGDWPNHPGELILPRGGELHDLRDGIILPFGDWVRFPSW